MLSNTIRSYAFGYVPRTCTYVRTSKGVCNSIYISKVLGKGERGIDVHQSAPWLMGFYGHALTW